MQQARISSKRVAQARRAKHYVSDDKDQLDAPSEAWRFFC